MSTNTRSGYKPITEEAWNELVAEIQAEHHYEEMLKFADKVALYPPEIWDNYNIIHAMYHSFMHEYWSNKA